LELLASESAVPSLVPGQRSCLKTRFDGTIIDETIGYTGFEEEEAEAMSMRRPREIT
jgi:hypothetical protein